MKDKPDNPADPFRKAVVEATRALAGDEADLEVKFTVDPPGLSGATARLPQVSHRMSAREVILARAHGDAYAMRARHHDPATHGRYMPAGETAQQLFEAMERARVEALAARRMPGVGDNLDALLCEEASRKNWAKSAEDVDVVEAARLLVRQHGSGRPLPEDAAPALEAWRETLEAQTGASLEDLTACLDRQDEFARLAWRMIEEMGYGDQLGDDPDEVEQPDEAPKEEPEQDDGEAETGQGPEQEPEADQDDSDGPSEERDDDSLAAVSIEADDDGLDSEEEFEDPDGPPPDATPRPEPDSEADPEYRVFSRAHDEVILAEDVCEEEELERLRGFLDQQLAPLQGAAARLANKLQRRLLAQQNRAWEFDREEGILDAGRLARVVANPTTPLSFKVERDADFRDTVVTLLIDNSGSMRGRPISIAAVSADILARTLERCSVKVEILGFTTRQWKGGEARKLWSEQGRTPSPGRLNDLRHIIYKAGGRALAARAAQSRADDARGALEGEHRRRGARMGA